MKKTKNLQGGKVINDSRVGLGHLIFGKTIVPLSDRRDCFETFGVIFIFSRKEAGRHTGVFRLARPTKIDAQAKTSSDKQVSFPFGVISI